MVVVDERIYRRANTAILAAIDAGDYSRANAGLTAMRQWLRYEIHIGRRSKRFVRAARLEQLEAQREQIGAQVGLVSCRVRQRLPVLQRPLREYV
jgi:hypothetical protein